LCVCWSTFPLLYVRWSHISTAVRMLVTHISTAVGMLATHFYSCTYVGHTFLQLYLCWPHISTAVGMLATHFNSCTYVGHTIRETSSKTISELDPSTNRNDVRVSPPTWCFLRYAAIVHNVKAKNGSFSYWRWPPVNSNFAPVFNLPSILKKEKKLFRQIAMLPTCLCFRVKFRITW